MELMYPIIWYKPIFTSISVTSSLSPPPLSQHPAGSKMISNRSSSNDDASQQSILNLPKQPNQYLQPSTFYNMGQLMMPPIQFPNGRVNQLYNNNPSQDISNVPQMLPQNIIVNHYYPMPYGIDPYAYPHNNPQNFPPRNSHSNNFNRPTGPNSYGRNSYHFSKK